MPRGVSRELWTQSNTCVFTSAEISGDTMSSFEFAESVNEINNLRIYFLELRKYLLQEQILTHCVLRKRQLEQGKDRSGAWHMVTLLPWLSLQCSRAELTTSQFGCKPFCPWSLVCICSVICYHFIHKGASPGSPAEITAPTQTALSNLFQKWVVWWISSNSTRYANCAPDAYGQNWWVFAFRSQKGC